MELTKKRRSKEHLYNIFFDNVFAVLSAAPIRTRDAAIGCADTPHHHDADHQQTSAESRFSDYR